MSTQDPGPGPDHEVDPSEKSDQRSAPDKQKDKDDKPRGKDEPSASSKGINPVQHSE